MPSMSGYAKFYFRPSGAEQIKTVIHIGPECRSALCGAVLDRLEKPLCDALVLLTKASEDGSDDTVLAYCFTEADGSFAFGPLDGGELYIVRVFGSGVRLRNIEISLD